MKLNSKVRETIISEGQLPSWFKLWEPAKFVPSETEKTEFAVFIPFSNDWAKFHRFRTFVAGKEGTSVTCDESFGNQMMKGSELWLE